MSTFTTSDSKWTASLTLQKQTGSKLTLSTTGRYVDKNIDLTLNVRSATASLTAPGTATISSVSYTYNSTNTNFVISGSATISGTSTFSVSQSGWVESTSTTAISGTASLNTTVARVGVGATLSGTGARKPTISRTGTTATTAINVGSAAATTSVPGNGFFVSVQSNANTATVTATPKVTSNGYGTTSYYGATNATATAGAAASDITYIPITTGAVNTPATTITANPIINNTPSSNKYTISVSKTQTVTPTVETNGWVTSSQASGGTITVSGSLQLNQSTLSATQVNSSTSDQTITISAGYYHEARTVKVNKMATSIPTTDYVGDNMTTYFTAGTSASYNVAITPRYSNSAGYVSAHTNTNNGGIGYWNIKTTSLTQGLSTKSGTVVTRATAYCGTGWITSTTMTPATFANTATSGTTYIDLSDTTEAPILASGDYLYINKGYTDSFKISLARLIPDASITTAVAAGHILQGYGAYNNQGTLLTGTIPTKTSANFSINAGTITVPSGYYAQNYSISITTGDYVAETATSTNSTVTPSVGLHANATSTYGFTTTAPSGTNGTNFLTIDPGATATNWSVTPKARITTAGYIATGNKTGTATTGTPSVQNGTNYYVPIVSTTFGGGGLTVNTNSNSITTTPVVTISASGTLLTSGTANYGVTTTQPSGTDGTNYLKIDASGAVTTTGKITSSVKMTRAAMTYNNAAGVIAAHSGTEAIASTSSTTGTAVNVTPTITDNFAPIYIPVTSVTFGGGTRKTLTNYSTTPTVSLSNGSDTNLVTDTYALGSKNTATYAYYFKVNANSTSASGSTKVEYNARTYSVGSGVIKAASGNAQAATSDSPTVTVNAGSGSSYVNIKAAAGSVTMSKGNGSCTLQSSSNVTTSDTNSSGVSVTFRGSGSVSATAKITTAGYTPTNNSFATGASTSSNTADLTKYITGVTLTKGKTFSITVPNGPLNSDGTNNGTVTFVFTVANDNTGNVMIMGPD